MDSPVYVQDAKVYAEAPPVYAEVPPVYAHAPPVYDQAPLVYAQAPPTVISIQQPSLMPGMCSLCRKGQIKDSASFCTWLWCLLCLPLGIIPGIIIFCCCCRGPKCTNCGFKC